MCKKKEKTISGTRGKSTSKFAQVGSDDPGDLRGKTPAELIEVAWQLSAAAWSYKEPSEEERKANRQIVVLKKRER